MKRVQEAAVAAGVLLEQEGELTGLEARLKEIETLKLDLKSAREEMDAKLQALEASLKDQLASSEQETAAASSLEMSVKGLLIKAQGEVLLAQVYWAEGDLRPRPGRSWPSPTRRCWTCCRPPPPRTSRTCRSW